jgi:hypothetical protein
MDCRLYQGRYEIECGTSALDIPFQQISSCVRMKSAVGLIIFAVPSIFYNTSQLSRCQAFMRDGCIDQFDHMNCGAAVAFCDAQLSTAYWASGQLN